MTPAPKNVSPSSGGGGGRSKITALWTGLTRPGKKKVWEKKTQPNPSIEKKIPPRKGKTPETIKLPWKSTPGPKKTQT